MPTAPARRRPRARLALERLEARDTPATGLFDGSFFSNGRQSFGFAAGALDESAAAVAVQPDGKLVVVGSAFDGTDFNFAVARLNRDGTLDNTFSFDGKQTVAFDLGGTNEDRATCVVVQPDGAIVVGGFAQTAVSGFNFAVCRLEPDGDPDPTFSGDGKVAFDVTTANTNDQAFAVALSGTNIVLAGTARVGTTDDFAAARVTAAGALDGGFSGDGRATVGFDLGGTNHDTCAGLIVDPDGGVVLGGSVPVGSAGTVEFAATRLLANGTLDTAFGFQPPGKVHVTAVDNPGSVHRLTGFARDPDGKLTFAGSADGPGGRDMVVVKLDPNGSSFDPVLNGTGKARVDFDLGGTNDDEAEALAIQPDGKILLAGTVGQQNGDRRFAVARLLPTGQLDPTFERDGKAVFAINNANADPDQCFDMALTPEGIVLVGESQTAAAGLDFAVMRTIRDQWVVVSADRGGPPTVKVMTPTGTTLYQFDAFDPAFRGGVRVTARDVTNDGIPDLFCAPGPGGQSVVRVFDGLTQALIKEIPVVAPTYKGGLNLAVGDVHSSPGPELVVARHAGAPQVFVYSVTTGLLLRKFLAFPATLTAGVRVTVADVIAGGFSEVVANLRSASRAIRAWNADTGVLAKSFLAPAPATGGLFLAANDFNDTGRDDLLIGRGAGLPIVSLVETETAAEFNQLLAYPTTHKTGVRVAAVDIDGDGRADAILAKGPKAPPEVTLIDPDTGFRFGTFLAFDPTMTAGLFVAAAFR